MRMEAASVVRNLAVVGVGLATAVLGSPAQARDLRGRTGLGASSAFAVLTNAVPIGGVAALISGPVGLSLKYQFNDSVAFNPGFGVRYSRQEGLMGGDPEVEFEYTAGARLLKVVVQEPNANFYVGAGLAVSKRVPPGGGAADPTFIFRVPGVFGAEVFFSKTSSFAFSAEAGFAFTHVRPGGMVAGAAAPTTSGVDTVGGLLAVAFHYYFSGKSAEQESE